ncbi:MAG: APC family permease [Terriglobales bacterium]
MPNQAQSGLVRAMGRWTLVALVINSIIGSGIFGLPSLVWKQVGGAAPWAYLLAGAGIGVIMACFAEVSSRFTEAGGPYLYARAAFGRFLGIEMGWVLWLVRLSAAAAGANLFVIYLAEFWPGAKLPFARALVLTVLLGVLATINYRGVKSGARMSNVFTVAKLVPLGLLAVAGTVFLLLRGGPAPTASPLHPAAGDWIQAVLLLVFAYGGFEAAMIPLAEAKDPRRDAPFALLVSLAVCVALFTLLQIVVQATLANPGQADRPLADAARQFMGTAGARFISLGALVSLYGYLSANMLNTPRLTFALAEHDDFPPIFRAVHPRFRTPHVSIVVSAVLVWLMALAGNFRWNVVLSAVARLFAYGAVCLAMLVLRRKQPGAARFPLPAGPLFAMLGIGFALVLVSRMGRAELAIIVVTMVIAFVNWLWAHRRKRMGASV